MLTMEFSMAKETADIRWRQRGTLPIQLFHGLTERSSTSSSLTSIIVPTHLASYGLMASKEVRETVAGDRAWLLRSDEDFPEVIRQSDDRQTMTLADNHVEGFIWHFARVP
jgi:hypothetical protein